MAPQTIMTAPINVLFQFLQTKARVELWLFDNPNMKIQGRIKGFDEYMNLVLEDAEEVYVKKEKRKHLGTILLKAVPLPKSLKTRFIKFQVKPSP